jgi:hypothetical protein
MSTKIVFLGSRALPKLKAENFLENVGASTSHNSMGFHGLLQGPLLPFYLPV